jgi:hypothetical protein
MDAVGKFFMGAVLGITATVVLHMVGRHDGDRLMEENRSLKEQLALLEGEEGTKDAS